MVQSEEGCWNKVADGLLRSQEIEQDFAVLAFCGTGAPWLILAQAHIPGVLEALESNRQECQTRDTGSRMAFPFLRSPGEMWWPPTLSGQLGPG